MKYKKGYKYQLNVREITQTDIHPPQTVENDYIKLTPMGLLFIKDGYAWDGPSGPTIDTKSFMRGSLVHDALYQLMREELIPLDWRKAADEALIDICESDGMWGVRRWWVFRALRLFGKAAAIPSNVKKILTAP